MTGDFLLNDLPTFYKSSEFAVSAVFTPYGGSAEDPITVLFDEGYIGVNPESGEDESINPTVRCIQTDLTGELTHNATFTIDSQAYKVLKFYPEKGEWIIELIQP